VPCIKPAVSTIPPPYPVCQPISRVNQRHLSEARREHELDIRGEDKFCFYRSISMESGKKSSVNRYYHIPSHSHQHSTKLETFASENRVDTKFCGNFGLLQNFVKFLRNAIKILYATFIFILQESRTLSLM
jgi:hypothetical protein